MYVCVKKHKENVAHRQCMCVCVFGGVVNAKGMQGGGGVLVGVCGWEGGCGGMGCMRARARGLGATAGAGVGVQDQVRSACGTGTAGVLA